MSFCHLHLHTDASLTDGAIQLAPLVARVSELGQLACAITDHGLLSNAVKFTKQARERGIRPIIGCEIYVATSEDMEKPAKSKGDQFHLTLLAATAEGYQNLSLLTTESYRRGYSHRPRLDHRTLERHAAGIIALSGCFGAELPKLLIAHREREAELLMQWYLRTFRERFYIEVQYHGALNGIDHVREVDEQTGQMLMTETDLNAALVALADRHGVGLVATNDAHYLSRDDGDAHDTLFCLGLGRWKKQEDRLRLPGAEVSVYEFYVKSEAEMCQMSPTGWWQTAVANTVLLLEQIQEDALPILGQKVLPVYEIPVDRGFEIWKQTGLLLR